MHPHRTGASAPHAGPVSGLGICDALRVELTRAQLPWLLDELDELRRALEEVRADAHAAAVTPELADLEYRLTLLRMLRDQLPGTAESGQVVLTGPAQLVSELIRGSLRHTLEALAELAGGPLNDAAWSARVASTAAAGLEWATTHLACRELEDYNFDPQADPVGLV